MQFDGILTAHLKLDGFEVYIHAMIDTNDSAVRYGAILEFHGDGLAAELDEEADELHMLWSSGVFSNVILAVVVETCALWFGNGDERSHRMGR